MSEIVDKAKALMSTYEQLLEQTRNERDAIRAELAAAKNLLARIHRDGGHHTEAVGFSQSVADADAKVSEWLLVAEERTALAAHVERLEKALKRIMGPLSAPDADGLIEDATCTYCDMSSLDGCDEDCPREIAAEALAATPAQSLAAHDAATKVAVLEEVANLIRQTTPDPVDGVPESFGSHQGRMYALEQILAEADRIAKEAANGQA